VIEMKNPYLLRMINTIRKNKSEIKNFYITSNCWYGTICICKWTNLIFVEAEK